MFDPNAEPPSPLSRRLPAWLATGDVHEWTKTVAVVVAALWGVYTFIWKDILVPSWAPASLVIEVKSRQEGPQARPAALRRSARQSSVLGLGVAGPWFAGWS